MQTHLTVREIGERLFVSRNTASSEIGSIYRKLGASSRSDAVRRAMAVGLLGGVADVTARTDTPTPLRCHTPGAIASFGAAATTLGSPTTGTTPTSTSTISAAVAPPPTAASACAP
jgi:hypothetical protein